MSYVDQSAYVDAIVYAVRRRLHAVVEATKSGTVVELHLHDCGDLDLRNEGRQAARAGIAMPLVELCERLKLSESEELAIWVLLANEIDAQSRLLLRDLNTEHAPDPTTDTVRRVVYSPTRRLRSVTELSQSGSLRHLMLVVRTDRDETAPEYRQTLALSRRTVGVAFGETRLDEALTGVAVVATPIDGRSLAINSDSLDRIHRAMEASALVLVRGQRGVGRRSAIVAGARDRGILQIDCTKLATETAAFDRQLRSIERECRLLSLVPLFQNLDSLAPIDGRERAEQLDSLPGLVLATASKEFNLAWRRDVTVIDLAAPTGDQLRVMWSQAIPEASRGDAELMATMYPLAPAMIVAAGARAHELASGTELGASHIAMGIRMVADKKLAVLARRVETSQSWQDLVLPDDQTIALAELIARIRQRTIVYENWGFANKVGRGLGVAALFSGPPGTGKTMAAGLIAKELGVDLFQIDISKISSKWIGETEKNLAALFDAAEAAHAMLLFDEADSLFGKRTEVKGSNDRHANQEVNFLLQRLETFTGVCVLTSNHESAIDEAFRRRLAVHIHLPIPEAEERRRIWNAMIPADAPVSSTLDTAPLAVRYAMSGGHIRNAVLRAAFLAADTTGVIDTPLLDRAAQLEYEAMGKIAMSYQQL
ncbi:MAG: ATP-binding protein [Kofleriaceae bacterium]